MSRRSTPQSKIDERAFPVRVLVYVPQSGFGARMYEVQEWLRRQLGTQGHAWHGGGKGGIRDRVAIYFRHPQAAAEFARAFPWLELADTVDAVTYTAPDKSDFQSEIEAMCNLYSQTRSQDAIRQIVKGMQVTDRLGNLEPGSVYPDQLGPIVRHDQSGGLEMTLARWGMPSPSGVLKTARDPGVTNVRNLHSPHWRRWLGPAHRCLVPVTSFAEPRGKGLGNQWFAPVEADMPMMFAGIETRAWTSLRKVRDGETTDDLYAFLTTAPNAEVAQIHPKAMPVILTTPAEFETWLTAPFEIASNLQRPLPDGALQLVDEPI